MAASGCLAVILYSLFRQALCLAVGEPMRHLLDPARTLCG